MAKHPRTMQVSGALPLRPSKRHNTPDGRVLRRGESVRGSFSPSRGSSTPVVEPRADYTKHGWHGGGANRRTPPPPRTYTSGKVI